MPEQIRVLLVDDSVVVLHGLKTILEENKNIVIVGTASTHDEAITAVKQDRPDVVLLDVEMDDGTGFDLMKQVPNPEFQLIFVTAHNQYAIEAFRFSAIDYLLKPVDPDALKSSIDRAVKNIRSTNLHLQVEVLLQQLAGRQSHDKKIVLRDLENTYFVRIADILYCEAEGTYTRFFITGEQPILVSKNLKEYEAILEPLGFIRTHHSFLANPDKIRQFDKTDGGSLILEGGTTIPVSQRKKEYVLQMLEKN